LFNFYVVQFTVQINNSTECTILIVLINGHVCFTIIITFCNSIFCAHFQFPCAPIL